MPTQYRSGDVTTTLDDGLNAFVRGLLSAAETETVRVLEAAAESVQTDATAQWYQVRTGVRRRTGRSGDIQVVTTFSEVEVRVSVGSTDLAKAKYVHRPGRLSTSAVEVEKGEYSEAKRQGGVRAGLYFHARRADPANGVETGKYYRKIISSDASDGRFLLPYLVTSPMRAKLKELAPELGRAIVKRAVS